MEAQMPPYQINELKFYDPKITRPDLIGKKKVVYSILLR